MSPDDDKASEIFQFSSSYQSTDPSTFFLKRGYRKLYSPHGFEQRLHVGIIYLQFQLGAALFLNCGKKKKKRTKDKDQISSISIGGKEIFDYLEMEDKRNYSINFRIETIDLQLSGTIA